jgi:hypothetical protein
MMKCGNESVSSPNYALSLITILAGFTFCFVRNVTKMRCTTAKGPICSLIMITTDKTQVNRQRYVISTNKVILFYARIFTLKEKKYGWKIFMKLDVRFCPSHYTSSGFEAITAMCKFRSPYTSVEGPRRYIFGRILLSIHPRQKYLQ